MITASQLVCHLIGDYIFQSQWMADNKTKSSFVALIHAVFYTMPFALLTQTWAALAVIAATHFLIDRFRLARFVCYGKNYLSPPSEWHSWETCSGTGYFKGGPPGFIAVWLLIIADNTLHIICNGVAIHYLK